MATHSSVLAWRIPGTGEHGGLPSMGSHRVGHDWSDLAAAAAEINRLTSISSQTFNLFDWDSHSSLVAQMVKNLPAVQETRVQSLGGKIPWGKEWLPTPVFLPGDFHGHRSLADYSRWGHTVRYDWATNNTFTWRNFASQPNSYLVSLFSPKTSLIYSILLFFFFLFCPVQYGSNSLKT